MTHESLTINCSEMEELQREFPQEMEIIIKMLTEVGEGCQLEKSNMKA